MNTNKKQKNPSVVIVLFSLILFAATYITNQEKSAKICGLMGEMELSALRTQQFVAESGGNPISEEDQKRLSFLATERRYGCN